jgi:hypothetical protein
MVATGLNACICPRASSRGGKRAQPITVQAAQRAVPGDRLGTGSDLSLVSIGLTYGS